MHCFYSLYSINCGRLITFQVRFLLELVWCLSNTVGLIELEVGGMISLVVVGANGLFNWFDEEVLFIRF